MKEKQVTEFYSHSSDLFLVGSQSEFVGADGDVLAEVVIVTTREVYLL